MVDDQQIAIRDRRRVSGPLAAVEKRHLTEDVASLVDRKHDLAASEREEADFDAAAQHRHHASSGRALGKDQFARPMMLHPGMRQHGIEIALAQLAKKAMPLKQPATFFEDGGAHPSALVGRQIPCLYAKASEVESLAPKGNRVSTIPWPGE